MCWFLNKRIVFGVIVAIVSYVLLSNLCPINDLISLCGNFGAIANFVTLEILEQQIDYAY